MEKSRKSNLTYKLTDEQREFLSDFAYLIRKWKVERLASLFGVSRKNADYLIQKQKEKKNEKK